MSYNYQTKYEATQQWSKYVLSVFFIVVLSTMFVINLIIPDKTISETENRPLSQVPRLNWTSIFDGSFSKGFEVYISDQFFLRDLWVNTKTTAQLILGKKDNNGVYYGSKGRLYEILDFEADIFNKNLQALEKFAKESGLPSFFLPAPSASYIQPSSLPRFAVVPQEDKFWKETKAQLPSFSFVPSIDRLKKYSSEYLYYYSDHHWTTLGAYYAYTALMDTMEMDYRNISDYRAHRPTEPFLGALHSKSAYRFVKSDSLTILEPRADVIVEYPATLKKSNTLFDMDKLKEKDKYSVFLGGNQPLVKITSSQGEGKLLVLKDSYGHSLIPLMAGQFKEIHLIDLRYYQGSVSKYIEDKGFTHLLALYGASSVGQQSFIAQLQ